jgi:enoyl-CoA hydratase/carnithine racemase
MTSDRAYALGLVNAVVALPDIDDEVDRWVNDILACAPLAIRSIKQCVMDGLGRSLPAALAAEYSFEAARRVSADSIEGPQAFAEKRQPLWSGH